MTNVDAERSLWSDLSVPWRVVVACAFAIAVAIAVSGAVIWRIHYNDDLYFLGVGLVMAGAILMWLVHFGAKWGARRSRQT
jgi:anti-sigma-K factor RskA